MGKRAKDKLVRSPRENGGGQDAKKISSLKNWKGREEGVDLGKDGKRKQKEIFKMLGVGGRQEKMEGHCSTGQSPQWAVASMEEEGVKNFIHFLKPEGLMRVRYKQTNAVDTLPIYLRLRILNCTAIYVSFFLVVSFIRDLQLKA